MARIYKNYKKYLQQFNKLEYFIRIMEIKMIFCSFLCILDQHAESASEMGPQKLGNLEVSSPDERIELMKNRFFFLSP